MAAAHPEHPPPPIPRRVSDASLREAVMRCRACELWAGATQPVMGEGAPDAELMLVGEQPGDREDIEGHPFVGPAGRVLDRGLEQAGISVGDVYITNAVKHFRYESRGKRRIHQRPERGQVRACLPWLEAELELVQPAALVCLGATSTQALLGREVRVSRDRGQPLNSSLAELVTVTTHPSAILRAGDGDERAAAMEAFVSDLAGVATWLAQRREGTAR